MQNQHCCLDLSYGGCKTASLGKSTTELYLLEILVLCCFRGGAGPHYTDHDRVSRRSSEPSRQVFRAAVRFSSASPGFKQKVKWFFTRGIRLQLLVLVPDT